MRVLEICKLPGLLFPKDRVLADSLYSVIEDKVHSTYVRSYDNRLQRGNGSQNPTTSITSQRQDYCMYDKLA